MRKLWLALMCTMIAVCANAQINVVKEYGNEFDGGRVLVSSDGVIQAGSSTKSRTLSLIDDATYTNSSSTQWLIENKGPYDIMIDSCIWSDKGTIALLGVDCPYVLEVGNWISVDGAVAGKVYSRALQNTLTQWSTVYYLKTGK